eukprot:PITA_35342
MKITLKLDVKPMKQRPYWLNPKYKEMVCLELDKMLAAGMIKPVGESNWVKCHVASLHLMLDTCWRYQIMLNLNKCLFCIPFGILLGHVVCTQGLMVEPMKITVIINLEVPTSVKKLHATLQHTGYYRKFIKSYDHITVRMEKLLNKDVMFCWNEECQKSLDVLNEKMVTTPILVIPDWKKEFHVHVDASCIALGAVLT